MSDQLEHRMLEAFKVVAPPADLLDSETSTPFWCLQTITAGLNAEQTVRRTWRTTPPPAASSTTRSPPSCSRPSRAGYGLTAADMNVLEGKCALSAIHYCRTRHTRMLNLHSQAEDLEDLQARITRRLAGGTTMCAIDGA